MINACVSLMCVRMHRSERLIGHRIRTANVHARAPFSAAALVIRTSFHANRFLVQAQAVVVVVLRPVVFLHV